MSRLSRCVIALLAVAATASAYATDLTPHRAEYKVRISVVTGELKTELRKVPEGYTATHVVRATGLSRLLTSGRIFVASTFTQVDDGVRPLFYHAIDTIGDEPEARITFDWATNTAWGTVDGEDVEFHLDGVAHDAVSIQYELMYDLLNNQPADTYVLFDVEKLRVAHIRRTGSKTVKTPAGTYEVVGIQHQKEGSSRITTLWCAPELDYLPVIIEQHRGDKLKFRATLSTYTPI